MASVSATLEISINSLQMFGNMIDDTGVTWPQNDPVSRGITGALNLGDKLLSEIPDMDDFRLRFMAIAVILPMVFVFVGLISVNPLRTILWMGMVLFGVITIFVGASGAIINDIVRSSNVRFQLTREASNTLIIIGSVTLFICLLLYGARKKLMTCCNERADKAEHNKHLSLDERMDDEIENVDWNATLTRVVCIVVLVVIGAAFVGVVNISGASDAIPIESLAKGLGWFMIALGLTMVPWFIMGLCLKGRMYQWKISYFAEHNFLRVYLLLLSIIYIPVGGSLFLVFNCNDFSCPAGSRLFDEGSQAPFNRTNTTDVCVPCDMRFPNRYCPSAVRGSMCAAAPEERLEADLTIKCSNIKPFFWPPAFIVMIFFMLGVPYLFFKLIRASTELLEEKFPDTMNDDGSFKICKYEESVLMTNNVARFLYQPFKEDMRYTRLFLLVQKLLIVFTAQFVFRVGTTDPVAIQVYCSLVIHFLCTLLLAYYRPFHHAFENWVAFFMQVALVVTAAITILIWYEVDMPQGLFITVVVLNLVLPVTALVVGIILEWRGRADQEEQDKAEAMEEVEAQLKKEQAAKDEELGQKTAQYQQEMQEYDAAVQRLDAEKLVAMEAVEVALDSGDINQDKARDMRAEVQRQFAQLYPTRPVDPALLQTDVSRAQFSPPREEHDEPSPRPAPDSNSDDDEHLQDTYGGQGLNPLSAMAATQNDSPLRLSEEERLQQMEDDDAEEKMYADETPDQKRKRRAARLRRRKKELHRRLMRKKEIQKELVEKKRNTVDMEIDDTIKEHLNTNIMVSGVFFVIAMCFCLVGLLSPDSIDVTGYGERTVAGTADYEFLGYGSWQNFTEACCCTAMASGTGDKVVEKWVCLNGKVKERLRKSNLTLPAVVDGVDSVSVDGFSIRGLCSPVFVSGCSLVAASDSPERREVGVHCFKGVPNVTGTAQRDLW